jgi:hypothetical protein
METRYQPRQLLSSMPWKICRWAFLVASLLISPIAVFAQTYTITSGSPQSLSITNVHAGDMVTVDATLFSGDPNENGEGEPLVLALPGGNFVVSGYFSPQQTTFLALQDNQLVSAFIQGADGDESAQVAFTVNAKKRYTQDQKDKFAKYAAILGGVGGGLGTVAAICGLAPEPTATKVCAVVGALGAGASAILAAKYGLMALDPCDPNFTDIFQPVLLTIPPIVAQPGITQAEANAANAWLLNEAQQLAFVQAIQVSINRANCAAASGDTTDETKQMLAAGNYAIQLAGFVNAASGARAALVSAIQAAGFAPVTFTANDVFNYEVNILFNGLPLDTLQALIALGADADTINFVTGILIVQDVNATAGTFPNFLNNSTTSSLEQSLAAGLITFGIANGATAGVPLKTGQMVQAQGWISSGQGKTTFALNAHVDQQGNLLGTLELNDHGGFSIQHGSVAHAFLIGNTAFSVDGGYVASNGSSQTWTASADARQQSIAISTSEGFSFSGVLGGGNVTIK